MTLGFDALSSSLYHHFPFFDRICLLPSLMQLHTHVGLLVLPSRLDVSSILYLINPHTLFRLPFSLAVSICIDLHTMFVDHLHPLYLQLPAYCCILSIRNVPYICCRFATCSVLAKYCY